MHVPANTASPLTRAIEPPAMDKGPMSKPRHFADLLDLVAGWQDLTSPQRSVMASCIRTAGLAAVMAAGQRRHEFGRPSRKQIDLRAVPCDPAWLNDHIFHVAPAALGILPNSMTNVITALRSALRRAGVIDDALPPLPETPNAWSGLLDAMARQGSLYAHGLKLFARWCHIAGIAPAEVTASTLTDHETYLRTRTLRADIPGQIRTIAKSWRIAARTLADDALSAIGAPQRRRRYTPRVEDFAPRLQDDVAAFRARLCGTDRSGPFRGDGVTKSLRPKSVKSRVFAIRLAVAALVQCGRPIESINALRDLVEEAAFDSILRFYWQRAIDRAVARGDFPSAAEAPASAGITSMVDGIASALMIVAQHFCKLSPEEIKPLAEMAADVKSPRSGGITPKNLARVRQLDDPKRRLDLLNLPSVLMKRANEIALAESAATRPAMRHRRAVIARNAVAIQLLLHAPVRLENLTSLQFGTHLRSDGSATGSITHLCLAAHKTKNHAAYETVVAPDLARMIAEYRQTHHPVLTPEGSRYLFPAGPKGSGHLTGGAMRSQLCSVIEKEVGVRVNPHLFRHLGVRWILEEDSGALEDARLLIGDKSMGVVLGAYASVEPAAAARRHHERLRRTRQGLAKASSQRGRKL